MSSKYEVARLTDGAFAITNETFLTRCQIDATDRAEAEEVARLANDASFDGRIWLPNDQITLLARAVHIQHEEFRRGARPTAD